MTIATRAIRMLVAGSVCLAVVAASWVLVAPRCFTDDAPLPRGNVSAPHIPAEKSRSQLRVFVRVGLGTLTRIVNTILPSSVDVAEEGAEGDDFSSVLTLGGSTTGETAPRPTPLPPLADTRPAPAVSRISIPMVVPVGELSHFWQPQQIPVAGGIFAIEAIDFTEQEGVLHGRMRFRFTPGGGGAPFFGRPINGGVRFQARPSCNARIGQLCVTDFAFSEKSDSLLVDMLGAGANATLRHGFEELVPLVSNGMLRRVEKEIRADGGDGLERPPGGRDRGRRQHRGRDRMISRNGARRRGADVRRRHDGCRSH